VAADRQRVLAQAQQDLDGYRAAAGMALDLLEQCADCLAANRCEDLARETPDEPKMNPAGDALAKRPGLGSWAVRCV